MWILECDGDILKRKRIWLRPGKKYLFGRTAPEGGRYAGFTISHKSVSRQHLTLSVSAVKPGEGSLVHARTEIVLEDQKTKLGTEIDGERIRDGKKVLRNDQHAFKLGSYEHFFRIKWQPVVLSFNFPSKDFKGGKDPLIPIRGRLEDLDIKAIIPYVIDKTTHVVASKRNTAKCLQALIYGKYIVDNSFMDALVYATTPGNLDEPESLSPLEEDFDGNWPDALQHLPPTSKEPSQRPAEFFAPDPRRKDVFEGYTFVYCNQTQFDNLQAPITSGGGKALMFTIDMGKTSAEDIVRYVKHVAGEKGLGEFEDGSEGKGVVVVRFRGDKDFEDWAIDVQHQVAQALDQRLIEQSEFLDAILINDASKLRRPLPEEDDDDSVPPATAATMRPPAVAQAGNPVGNDAPNAGLPVSQPPTTRTRPRGTVVSYFKGFDDGFDEAAILTQRRKVERSQIDSMPNRSSQLGSNGVSLPESGLGVDSQEHENPISRSQNPRKRPLSPPADENDEDMVESLLPAAAAMKRRRIEEEKDAQLNGGSLEPSFGKQQKQAVEPPKKAKPRKEVNIQEVVRERREAEDAAARRDEESLRETLDGLSVEEMKNLAVVEEMDLPERTVRPQRKNADGDNDDRWDERWNGRKNFKKFRRRGEGDHPRRGQSVIVPLEEVRKKDFGIGEEYWLESDKSKKKRKEKERTSQSQSQPFATARSQPTQAPPELAMEDEPAVIDVAAPRTTRLMEKSSQIEHNGDRSQTRNGKRPAPVSAKGVVTKKQKTFAVEESDSDSEDELKFRFNKRR